MDPNGEICNSNQNNPNVWFLAGTFGGFVNRYYTIPYGKSILFPIINYQCSQSDYQLCKPEDKLEEECSWEIDQITDIYASLDNRNIDIIKNRIKSGCFVVDVPDW